MVHGGIPFNPPGLSLILGNRLYLGMVDHHGKAYKGGHEAIVAKHLFDAVQAQLAANRHRHSRRMTKAAGCPLTGAIFDANGQPMRPSFSYGRGSKMYRYHVSESQLPSGRMANGSNRQGIRLPAAPVE